MSSAGSQARSNCTPLTACPPEESASDNHTLSPGLAIWPDAESVAACTHAAEANRTVISHTRIVRGKADRNLLKLLPPLFGLGQCGTFSPPRRAVRWRVCPFSIPPAPAY